MSECMRNHGVTLSIFCLLFALPRLGVAAIDQNDPLVTLKLQNAPLRLALQNISRQTGVTFVYGDASLEGIVINCDLERIDRKSVV